MSIRHGSFFRREQTLDDGVFGSIAYRPVPANLPTSSRHFLKSIRRKKPLGFPRGFDGFSV